MTSRMTVRSDQRRTDSDRRKTYGCRTQFPTNRSHRGMRPPPSTIGTASRPMAFEPLP
jgi:hypothetical protein